MKTINNDIYNKIQVKDAKDIGAKAIHIHQSGDFIVVSEQGAAELIKVLQEWVDEH